MKETTLAAAADRILRTKHEGFSPTYDDEHGNTQMTWYDQDAERLADWFRASNADGPGCNMELCGAVMVAMADILGDRLMDHAAFNEMIRIVGKMESVWNTFPKGEQQDDATDRDGGD